MRKQSQYAFGVLAVLFVATSTHARAIEAHAASADFVRLGRVTASHPLPDGIEIQSGSAVMQITALRAGVVRVRVGPHGALPEDASWAVLPASRTASVTVTPQDSATTVGFTTANLRVVVEKNPLAITVIDNDGHVLLAQMPERPIEFHGTEFRVFLQSPWSEHYFGLGDKPGPLDRRNEAFTDWNTDAFGWQESTDPIYKSIPYFLTFHKGISAGVFLDNTWRASFEFNKIYQHGYSFGSEAGPLDFYVMYGPTPKQVVEKWAWLVGKTPMPPMWALGYQQSRYSYYPESEVRRIASTLRKDRIPADVIWLDIDYQHKYWPFTVDRERFPTFEQMIKDLRAEHLRTVLITDLHIADQPNQGYKPYDEGIAGDHFVKNPDGTIYVGKVWPGNAVFPDFTQKSTRDWWGTLYKQFVDDGAAGFWNDMNEPAIFEVPTKTMPGDIQHRIDEPGFKSRIATHLEVHNIFGMQNSRGTFDGLLRLRPNMRPFVMTRASYAGGQRYAATWTGDNSSTWNHLRQTIPQLENLGLSGFAMSGADVGGFAGSPQSQLLTRWLEVAAFQPIDRDHTAIGTNPQEPWENGTPADLALRRKYIGERYYLMPYLYTLAKSMSDTGLPMMRPLFLEFPHGAQDGEPLDLLDAGSFMLGPDLLVAQSPYPDEVDDYTVTLPPGGWYNYWSGARVAGTTGRKDMDNAAVKQPELKLKNGIELPIFVRAGAILPQQPLVQSTDIKPVGPLTLQVFPPTEKDEACEGHVYLDDGLTYDFRKGDYLQMRFTCKVTATGIELTVEPHEGSYAPWWKDLSVEVYGATKPAKGASVAALDGLGAKPVQTAFNAQKHRIRTVVPDGGQGLRVMVEY